MRCAVVLQKLLWCKYDVSDKKSWRNMGYRIIFVPKTLRAVSVYEFLNQNLFKVIIYLSIAALSLLNELIIIFNYFLLFNFSITYIIAFTS